MYFYSFKYNLSIVNVIFMKNIQLYELDVRNSKNSVVFTPYLIYYLIILTAFTS